MITGLHKILVCLSLFSASFLAATCNTICEFDLTKSTEPASLHDLGSCHESSAPKEESHCEWDMGSLNLSHKEKLAYSFALLSFLSSYISFVDSILNIDIVATNLFDPIVPIYLYSDPVSNINTIRILI